MKFPTPRLGTVAGFIRGVSFKPDDVRPLGTENTIACFRTKNIQAEIDLTDVWAVPSSTVNRDEQIIQEGDLLISTANSWNLVGKCCWVPRLDWPATLGGFISALRPKRTEVFPRFLYHWFSSSPIQAKLRGCARQTTNISNLDLNQALDLCIPLPPMEEQRRIAAVLDKADALRQKRRTALQLLDSLTQSLFLDMFGDPATNSKSMPAVALGDLFLEPPCYGSMTPPGERGRWTSLRVGNIQDWKLDLVDEKYIDLPAGKVGRYSLKDGDIVLARAIASQDHLGKCIVVYPGQRLWAFDSHLMRLRLDLNRILPEYLSAMFRTSGGRSLFLSVTRRSAVQFNVNTKEMASLRIPLAPIESQQRFLKELSVAQNAELSLQRSAAEMDSLFLSLQQQAFSGGI